MAAKKLTLEDKRKKILEIFHEKRDVFSLKDIEKIASKNKDIVLQTVKEILMSLVDEYLVNQDKLGISNVFWSFLPQKGAAEKISLEKNLLHIKNQNSKIETLRQTLQNEKKDRIKDSKREILIEEWLNLKNQILLIKQKMNVYAECDPDVYKERINEIKEFKKNINNVIDKIYNFQSFAKNKFNIEPSQFYENFNIPEDLDYVNL